MLTVERFLPWSSLSLPVEKKNVNKKDLKEEKEKKKVKKKEKHTNHQNLYILVSILRWYSKHDLLKRKKWKIFKRINIFQEIFRLLSLWKKHFLWKGFKTLLLGIWYMAKVKKGIEKKRKGIEKGFLLCGSVEADTHNRHRDNVVCHMPNSDPCQCCKTVKIFVGFFTFFHIPSLSTHSLPALTQFVLIVFNHTWMNVLCSTKKNVISIV